MMDNGRNVSDVVFVKAGDDLDAALTTAGPDSLVVADGSAGTIDTSGTSTLQVGQTLTGAGQAITLVGDTSGRNFNYSLPGSRATINNTVGGNTIAVSNDSVLKNVDIVDGGDGISIIGDNNVRINNVTVTDAAFSGINIATGASDITITDTTVTGSGSSGVRIDGVSDVAVTNTNVVDSGDDGFRVDTSTGISISDSTVSGADLTGVYIVDSTVSLNNTDIENPVGNGVSVNNSTVSGSGNNLNNIGGTNCTTSITNTGSIDLGAAGTCP